MKLEKEKVIDYYNAKQEIWPNSDKWHYYVFLKIRSFITTSIKIHENPVILNAGSGGNSYGINHDEIHHLDIAHKLIESKKNIIIGSIELIPKIDNSFTNIICVGSVLNYCDPVASIKEFARVLKNGGQLILEFEKSNTFELFFKNSYGDNAVLQKTFYDGEQIIIWYFSEKYITNLLSSYGFVIIKMKRFHFLSGLIYRFSKISNFSAWFAKLDFIFRYIPGIRLISSNVIIEAKLIK